MALFFLFGLRRSGSVLVFLALSIFLLFLEQAVGRLGFFILFSAHYHSHLIITLLLLLSSPPPFQLTLYGVFILCKTVSTFSYTLHTQSILVKSLTQEKKKARKQFYPLSIATPQEGRGKKISTSDDTNKPTSSCVAPMTYRRHEAQQTVAKTASESFVVCMCT